MNDHAGKERRLELPVTDKCFIWETHAASLFKVMEPEPSLNLPEEYYVDSERAGGSYRTYADLKPRLNALTEQQKARLTIWLIDQRNLGIEVPMITEEILIYAENRRNLRPHERAERLLRYLASQTETIDAGISVHEDTFAAYAWSESTRWEEVVYLLNYLRDSGWLVDTGTNNRISKEIGLVIGVITVEGYSKIADDATNTVSSQVFVALWFNPELNPVYDHAIVPAVEAAGFTPYRVDREHFLGKIDDHIIAEIRRSRFLIADMTHGDQGARGSVYFEAGFAFGLGLPVIYTCRNDMLDKLHFDTRQYPHIDWNHEDLGKFRLNLENRIRASIT